MGHMTCGTVVLLNKEQIRNNDGNLESQSLCVGIKCPPNSLSLVKTKRTKRTRYSMKKSTGDTLSPLKHSYKIREFTQEPLLKRTRNTLNLMYLDFSKVV